ncbi:hypothetical protein MEN41_21430, partial [Dolichospermum sp. ST_con]|nr:hypothetical protein [Dolichospermum sp. ST_con]
YVVDNLADTVIERSGVGSGTDTVNAFINYSLGDNFEIMSLFGGDINGTGNDSNNTINGSAGTNIIDGGLGADIMIGLLGNDFYYVDNSGDIVTELANSGIDSVFSSLEGTIGYTLSSETENLTLIGGATVGRGNSANNRLIGNSAPSTLSGGAGNDFLNGGAGIDSLVGGDGDDKYVIDSNDVVLELAVATSGIQGATSGIDSVFSFVTYTVGDNVENLSLLGSSAINGTGNNTSNSISGNDANNTLTGAGGNDIIYGNAGNDILIGDAGNDSLTGGLGSDRFQYTTGGTNTFSTSVFGTDIITDFVSGTDKINVGKDTFKLVTTAGTTGLPVADFASVASDDLVALNTAKLVYSSGTGNLYSNQNGSATGGDVLVATLGRINNIFPTLAAGDFTVIV